MNKIQKITLGYLVSLSISGCSTFGPEKNLFGDNRVTSASANQMFDKGFEKFTDEQLVQLLDPDGALQEGKVEPLPLAFKNANNAAYGVAHRSQIQDRLIAASNQRCNLYMTYLKRISEYTNGIFGTLTTVLGGAGAIVTGADTARLLSGLAGISSGTRAELNQAVFESIATSVIIPGIQKTRIDLLKEIENKRIKPLDQYTVEGAVADAISYHGACSMDTGIAYAQKTIQSYDDIGIKRFTTIQAELETARKLSDSFLMGQISSVIVAEKVLDDFSAKLSEYKWKVDSAQVAQQPLLKMLTDLEAAIAKEGALQKEAATLDEDLKVVMLNYVSAVGAEKTNSYPALEAQQIKAREFSRKIEAKNNELLIEMKKLNKIS